MIKKVISFIASWSLYWTGHIVSKVMEMQEDGGWFFDLLYPTYNKLMLLSGDIQEWGGSGPWVMHSTELSRREQ